MRANIYSLNPMESHIEEAIRDGLGMITAYMGETIIMRSLLVRLPRDREGLVAPKRVGLANLDPEVDLHVFAVPLQGPEETIGTSPFEKGVSYIDTRSQDEKIMRSVTAHEVLHSLGFVLSGSDHEDSTSRNHCSDKSCIMHAKLEVLIETARQITQRRLFERKLVRSSSREQSSILKLVNGQYDLCQDCKIDLREAGQSKLSSIRHARLICGLF